MGMKQDDAVTLSTLSKIDKQLRVKTGINHSVYGFKKSDSMNRRFMLKNLLLEAYNEKTQKGYPLSNYNNKFILNYIKKQRIINPLSYGQKTRSTGFDITSLEMLLWLQEKYPDDLERVYEFFPATKTILFEYEHQRKSNANSQ